MSTACRQSVWCWKVLLSYQWQQKGQHINVLELAAVLDVMRKLAKDPKYHEKRARV